MITRFFIRADHDVLTLRTSGLLRFLSLYSWDYLVTVDRYLEMVTIESKFQWQRRPVQQIPFSRISHIDYDFSTSKSPDEPESWNDPDRRPWERPWETFTVRLSLKNPSDHVEIARFKGREGGFFGDEELILGVEWAGEVRAYPVRMLRYHHVVNDTVGGEPLLVTY